MSRVTLSFPIKNCKLSCIGANHGIIFSCIDPGKKPISFPTGFHNGLPLGMQLVSNKLQESKLLSSCYQFQKVTDYHKKWPSQ